VRARRRSTSASTLARSSFSTSSRPGVPILEGKFGNPSRLRWATGAKRSLPRGEMRRELIPTIFRVEFLKFGMVAANNHQAG
jgi:hypothetical protein